jgi:ABC-2 type transport system permease protein
MSAKTEPNDAVRTDTPSSPIAASNRSGAGRAWLLVTQREIMVKATDRSFLIGTLVSIAVIAGLIAIQVLLASRTQEYTVVATSSAAAMADAVERAAPGIDKNVDVTVREVTDDASARAAVTDESADAWLHPHDDGWVLTTKSDTQGGLEQVVAEVVRDEVLKGNASAAGTTVDDITRGSTLDTSLLQGDTQRSTLARIVGFSFAFLFYTASLMFGITLANSVVEEKQSRIVEIIATAIPLRHLLAGKVLGNTMLAVVQLTLYVAVGLIGLAFTEYSDLIPAISGPIVWFVVFFLAGFGALACLWAVAGSLASRTEDLQSTTTPLTLLILTVLFGGLLLEGTWQTVGSFIPPLSAVLMPIRLIEQDAAWWEAALALALLLAMAATTVTLGERIYRRSLLQSGGRVSVRRAWRTEE